MAKGSGLYNWLAPVGPRGIRREARALLLAQTNPLLRDIQRRLDRDLSSSEKAIGTGTQALMGRLGQIGNQQAADNQAALGQQQGIDQGLLALLSQRSGQIQGDLEGSLGSLGGAGGAGLGGAAAGLQAGLAGQGATTQSRLVAEGAARLGAARQLPAVAGLQGADTLRRRTSELTKGAQDARGEIRAGMPGTLLELVQMLQDREERKAIARQGFNLDNKRLRLDARAQAAEDRRFYDQLAADLQLDAGNESDADKAARERRENQREARQDARNDARDKGFDYAKDELTFTTKDRRGQTIKYLYGQKIVNGKVRGKPDWNGALRKMISYLAPSLRDVGVRPQRIRQIAANALVAAGFDRPTRVKNAPPHPSPDTEDRMG